MSPTSLSPPRRRVEQPAPEHRSGSIRNPTCGKYLLKRPLDVLAAALLLALAAPVMLAIALAIRLTSPGPALYRQKRLGLGEKPFSILKFRSMRVDADRIGPQSTSAGDPRITAVGRFIRKTSLDELPQLWNVLRGEMSLIGPRPVVGFELADWSAEERAIRASVRPGISGEAQVSGRSALSPAECRQLDLGYARDCRLGRDIRLIWRTLLVVLLRRGSN